MHTNIISLRILTLTLASLIAVNIAAAKTATSNMVSIKAERLPDLTTPRTGHTIFWADGEVMIAGGHTTGFKPTPTAEFLRDGHWQQVPMVYNHDHAFALQLSSGQIIFAGGHEQDLGLGQLYAIERYEPSTRQFIGFGSLDTKRVYAGGVELDSGRVVISGNWYHADDIEMYTGEIISKAIKAVAVKRSHPYVFRTASDDAIILGSCDPKGQPIPHPVVADRLKGDTIHIPLFATWRPYYNQLITQTAQSFIGDEVTGRYAYLMPVVDEAHQMAIAKVEGTDVSLLPTTRSIPQVGTAGDSIFYFSTVLADRQRSRAYLLGIDSLHHFYVVAIDYDAPHRQPAPLTCYVTDTVPDVGGTLPLLTPDGDIILAGGQCPEHTHFAPFSGACRLPMSRIDGAAALAADADDTGIPWGLLAVVVALGAAGGLWAWNRQHKQTAGNSAETEPLPTKTDDTAPADDNAQLMQHLCELMMQRRLFTNSELKVSEVSQLLGVSQRRLSQCLTAERGCTFSSFINSYRVELAKKIIAEQPEKKFSSVALECGFANETSFYRTFKSFTGLTPGAWIKKDE